MGKKEKYELRVVGTRSTVALRPLVRLGPAETIEEELRSEWSAGASHTGRGERILFFHDVSIAAAFLGLTNDDPTRMLELAQAVGVDWASDVVERRPLPNRAAITGAKVVELIREALLSVGDSLDAMRSAMAVDQHHDLKSSWYTNLNRLLSRVTMGVQPLVGGVDGPDAFVLVYRSANLIALGAVEIILRLTDGHPAATCAHCGCAFFTTERVDERYCRRIAPGMPLMPTRTCHQVGPRRQYRRALDPRKAVYQNRLKVMDQRRRRGQIGDDALRDWLDEARTALHTRDPNEPLEVFKERLITAEEYWMTVHRERET